MPKVNMHAVEDAQDFTPIPDGEYLAQLVEVDENKTTRDGDPMWSVRWQVLEGEHAGRYVFDNLVFSAKALKRVKLVFSRLGLDVAKDQEVDWTPDMIIGKQARITVVTEEYEDQSGQKKKRSSIPYAGFEAVEMVTGANGETEAVPF